MSSNEKKDNEPLEKSLDEPSEKFLKKLIDDMLAPVGLKTRRGRARSSFQDLRTSGIFLKDISSGAVGAVCRVFSTRDLSERPLADSVYKYLVCNSYAQLAKCLEKVTWIEVPGRLFGDCGFREIMNPCFGKGIDELIVTRDLLK